MFNRVSSGSDPTARIWQTTLSCKADESKAEAKDGMKQTSKKYDCSTLAVQ